MPGLTYYLGVSYRRKLIDSDLDAHRHLLVGRVLDVGGGRQRGRFRPTEDHWLVVDIHPRPAVDVVADIQAMPFREATFDAVKATEIFEHVPDVSAALAECRRVLAGGGHLVATVPFLERLHADPDDYARFTRSKWEDLLRGVGLVPHTIAPQGGYFTHVAGLVRFLVLRAPAGLRHAGYLTFPLLDLLAWLDRLPRVRNSTLASFVGGYFIIASR